MSKAFTKESDQDDAAILQSAEPALPPGARNYMTPSGHARLKAEFEELTRTQNADARRIGYLRKSLELADVIDPAQQDTKRVVFGTAVEVVNENGERLVYQIVGIDEVDATSGKISWTSPIARALLQAQRGDTRTAQTPAGPQELEVVEISKVD